jgi:hypothetical protein
VLAEDERHMADGARTAVYHSITAGPNP